MIFCVASAAELHQYCFCVYQLERYAYWTNLLLSYRRPVLVTGEVGVGKTSLIEVRLIVYICVFYTVQF